MREDLSKHELMVVNAVRRAFPAIGIVEPPKDEDASLCIGKYILIARAQVQVKGIGGRTVTTSGWVVEHEVSEPSTLWHPEGVYVVEDGQHTGFAHALHQAVSMALTHVLEQAIRSGFDDILADELTTP